MWYLGRGIPGIVIGAILIFVAYCPEVSSQEPEDRDVDAPQKVQKGDVGGDDRQKMSKLLLKTERVLRGIQNRAAGDLSFKQLAKGPIHRREYAESFELGIGAPTGGQIEIPTKGDRDSVKIPGDVGISISYSEKVIGAEVESGLHYGSVEWKTKAPHVSVSLSWLSSDAALPDRLLAIVRDELSREGLQLIPRKILDWPFATVAERLSQLLPPETAPAVAPKVLGPNAIPDGAPGGFASPLDVVVAYRRAKAKKDWRASYLCLTPASQGSIFRELLSAAQMGRDAKLARTIEKHLKLKVFDDDYGFLDSKELNGFFEPPGRTPGRVDEPALAWLHESVRRRVGDVPDFLADCMRQLPDALTNDGDRLECEGIRIEGDKASGYLIDRQPTPKSEEIEKHRTTYYLPRYIPIRFRRIDGNWLIASTFGYDL